MQDLVERVRQAVAKRHNVTLSEDDPVLMTAIICDETLSSYSERFQALLEAHGKELSEIKKMEINEATKISTTLINRTLETLGPSVTQTLQDDFRAMSEKQLEKYENVLQNNIAAIKQTSQIALIKNYCIIGLCSFILGFLFKSYVFP